MRSLFFRPQVVLILITSFWGSTFVVTKDVLSVQHMPPVLYVTTRYLLGALLMIVLYPFFEKRTKKPISLYHGILKQSMILGFLQAFGIALQVLGQHYTDPSKSAFLTAFSMPLTPLLAFVFYRDGIRKSHIVAILVGIVGLVLLTYPQEGLSLNLGDFLTLACAIVYAFSTIQIVRFARPEFAIRLAAGQSMVAAIFLGMLLLVVYLLPENTSWLMQMEKQELRMWVPSLRLVLQWLYMVLVCTVLTFFLQNWAMARMNTTQAAVIFALEPVFATILAIFWFHEWPKERATLGAGLILLALLVSEIPSSSIGKKKHLRND